MVINLSMVDVAKMQVSKFGEGTSNGSEVKKAYVKHFLVVIMHVFTNRLVGGNLARSKFAAKNWHIFTVCRTGDNRNNYMEKSIIDNVIATPEVAKQTKNIIIDKIGTLRKEGKEGRKVTTSLSPWRPHVKSENAKKQDVYGVWTMKKPGVISTKKYRTSQKK